MKNYTDLFIKRPVLSSALSILILLLGLFSLNYMPLRLFPQVVSPLISIKTIYPGANGRTMNVYVTSIIERALSGIDHVNYISASSSQNVSTVEIHMQLGADADKALSAVMARISAISDQLPRQAEKPVITVDNGDSDPAMILAATSQNMNRREVAEYLRESIEPLLASINGVSQAQVMGRMPAMRLWLNPEKMAMRGITASDVNEAIHAHNVLTAGGKIEGDLNFFNIQAVTNLQEVQEFNNVVIKQNKDITIRLKDIGQADIGDRSNEISAYYNGQPASMIFIRLTPKANPVEVTDQIRKMLPDINKNLPADMKIYNVVDSGRYLHESMNEVMWTLVIAAVIIVFTIYLFLGSWHAVLVPVITIPLSLIGVCSLLLACHFSINTLSLLAMVVAIGLIVDDAIVVLENIFRHLEQGMPVYQAALVGAREIANPVIAISITLAAVYFPIAFSGGLTGQLFKEFALTLSASVLISCLIALTLSPMMCSKLLSLDLLKNKWVMKVEHTYEVLTKFYKTYLILSLKNKSKVLFVWLACLFATLILLIVLPKQLSPEEDQGILIAISTTPNYTNSHFLNRYAQELMPIFANHSAIESEVTVAGIPGSHQALSFISLKDWGERKESAMSLQKTLQAQVDNVTGMQTFIINPPSLPGESDLALQIVLKSNASYEELYKAANSLINQSWASGLFNFVKTDVRYDEPALKIEINRNKANLLGISMQQIADTLNLLLGEANLQTYIKNDRSYFVIAQLASDFRLNPQDLEKINLRSASGKLIPLSHVAEFHKTVEMEKFNQFQKLNAITISGEMAAGKSLNQGIAFFQTLINQQHLPIILDFSGQTRQFIEEKDRMFWIFTGACLFIFLVLAIQFESYRLPLIILLGSAPLAIFSACLFLFLGFGSLNIYTQIGLLTLVGLISKHGILIVNFANHLGEQGQDKYQAILQACLTRFRPILMTTAAMVFGVLPLVLSVGAGSISRNQLGIVIASGLLLGTFLTLLILPVLYLYIAPDFGKKNEYS